VGMFICIPINSVILISHYEITRHIVWTADISDCKALVLWSVLIGFTVSGDDLQISAPPRYQTETEEKGK
jgi:hypothetical protein